MKRIIFGLIVAAVSAAILVPLAVAGGNSDNAKACQQGGWQGFVRTEEGRGFSNQDECVSYAAHGGTLKQKPTGPIAVSEPMFNYNVNTCSVKVPYTPGLDTRLYGVNGYPQDVPITHDVTITAGLDGLDGTADQFWIGYTLQSGYMDTN